MVIALTHIGMARTGMPIWLVWVVTTLLPTILAGLSGGVPAAVGVGVLWGVTSTWCTGIASKAKQTEGWRSWGESE